MEINPKSELFTKIRDNRDQNLIEDVAKLLLDQARLFNGEQIKDSVAFVERMNRVMTKAL